MIKSAEALFALIRYALGTQVVDSDAVVLRDLRFADWSKVVDLAFEQGVASIAVDGLQRRSEVRVFF